MNVCYLGHFKPFQNAFKVISKKYMSNCTLPIGAGHSPKSVRLQEMKDKEGDRLQNIFLNDSTWVFRPKKFSCKL